eukprot:m.19061 g.19061  ORF g.19061 m.19061 type:complete len:261 (-) comp8609_c0_seq2:116-898(-)
MHDLHLETLCLQSIASAVKENNYSHIRAHVQKLPHRLRANLFTLLTRRNLITEDVCDMFLTENTTAIDLMDAQVSSTTLSIIIERCPLLTSFSCQYSGPSPALRCTDAALSRLFGTCGLYMTKINLSRCHIAGDRTLLTIVECCPEVQVLDISKNSQYSTQALSQVWNLRKLKTLNLSLTKADDSMFEALAQAEHDVPLKELQIAHCPLISDAGFEALIQKCPHLRIIDMRGSNGITAQSRVTVEALHQRPAYMTWSIPV